MDRLGSRSSWAGQRAIQPPPAFRPARTLAIVSAFMVHLANCRGGLLSSLVRWNGYFDARPLGEDGEEACNVLGDLSGVLEAQITPETWPPDLPSSVD
jgi:hypothetical protein